MSFKILGCNCVPNALFGGSKFAKGIRISANNNFPQAALKLPTNIVDINEAEVGRFSPLRERDISGPVITSHFQWQEKVATGIDITSDVDPHTNKYDCRGAVSLSSSMQSNVPSPFSGNHTHLNMPGSQWGQGYKYLSDHLKSAHYLTLRNEYREKMFNRAATMGKRSLSTDANPAFNSKDSEKDSKDLTKKVDNKSTKCEVNSDLPRSVNPPLGPKEKLKKAVKEYGSTVIVFHIGISLLSLGGFYVLVSSGVDVVGLLKYLNVGEGTVSKIVGSNAGTFVIAYAVHKVFAPLRMAITLTATPFIVRFLRNIGFLKTSISSGGGK